MFVPGSAQHTIVLRRGAGCFALLHHLDIRAVTWNMLLRTRAQLYDRGQVQRGSNSPTRMCKTETLCMRTAGSATPPRGDAFFKSAHQDLASDVQAPDVQAGAAAKRSRVSEGLSLLASAGNAATAWQAALDPGSNPLLHPCMHLAQPQNAAAPAALQVTPVAGLSPFA